MDYLKAFVALITLLKELVDWLKEATKEDPTKFLKDLSAVIAEVKSAKTVEEKQASAAKLRDLIGGL